MLQNSFTKNEFAVLAFYYKTLELSFTSVLLGVTLVALSLATAPSWNTTVALSFAVLLTRFIKAVLLPQRWHLVSPCWDLAAEW